MKALLYNLLGTIFLLLSACGTIEVRVERTPLPTDALQEGQAKTEARGMLYFWLSHSTFDTKDPFTQIEVGRIARLPGACVYVDAECPAPEEVSVPFQIHSSSWQPMAWSPDGTMAILPVAVTDDLVPMTVYLYRPGDESWTEIASFPVIDSISWSPQKQTLEIVQPDGKVKEPLASFSKGGIYIVAWSHDGGQIAFTVQSDPYTFDDHRVYKINRDGTGLAELYQGIVIPALTFSPDDRHLFFTDQERSLVSISLDTQAVQRISVPVAEAGEQILYPSWQP